MVPIRCWGHYAEKHHGIVIGSKCPTKATCIIGEVSAKGACGAGRPRDLVGADVEDLLLTSSPPGDMVGNIESFKSRLADIYEGGLYFEATTDDLKPVEVIVGDRSTITRADLAKRWATPAIRITAFKARPAFGNFDVVRNKNDALWNGRNGRRAAGEMSGQSREVAYRRKGCGRRLSK